MNWQIGQLVNTEILAERRAEYAQQIVVTLSPQLGKRYGRGFDRRNLYRMIKFAQLVPEREIVVTLSRQLSWSHIIAIIAVDDVAARLFYVSQALDARLSVRALRELIGRQGFERREIANAQTPGGSAVPLDTFSDPYFLDFLGLKDTYAERDLEDALIREMETFLLEVGNGWTFVARQKRMTVGNDDFVLDLLFYSRPLHRLIAVELKVGKFPPSFKGQMDLLPQVARALRAAERRGSASGPDLVYRDQPGADRAARDAQGWHRRGRVLDGAAAARGTPTADHADLPRCQGTSRPPRARTGRR